MSTKTPTEITCEFVLKCAAKHGLTLVQEHRSWEKFTDAKTGHKLCVSYTKGETPYVDTTVDITSLEGVQTRGKDAKENGRFVSLFLASAPLIEAAIEVKKKGKSVLPEIMIPLAGTVFLWRAVFAEKGGGMQGYEQLCRVRGTAARKPGCPSLQS